MLFFVSMLSRYFIYEDLPGALVDMIYVHAIGVLPIPSSGVLPQLVSSLWMPCC